MYHPSTIVYFGEIGQNSQILIDYFVRNGAPPCPPDANPAEWMLDVIGAAPGSHTSINWFETWRRSPEYARVQEHLAELKHERRHQTNLFRTTSGQKREDKDSYREFAAPFWAQLYQVQVRVFQQIWRSPTYIYSKTALCVLSALFVGFSLFHTPNTIQGLQNQMFGIFMLLTLFGQLIQQIMPHFVAQRALYEVRDRPAKTYSWKAFLIANIVVELPWNSLMSVLMFLCWYYPIGLYRNAEPTDAVHLRGTQMWLMIWTFLLFSSTFAHFMIAAFDAAENAGNLGNLLFLLCLLFCGVLATPDQLPRFWIFMYRVSPFTYLVSGMLSVGISNTNVTCRIWAGTLQTRWRLRTAASARSRRRMCSSVEFRRVTRISGGTLGSCGYLLFSISLQLVRCTGGFVFHETRSQLQRPSERCFSLGLSITTGSMKVSLYSTHALCI